jgi:hypothetical protein
VMARLLECEMFGGFVSTHKSTGYFFQGHGSGGVPCHSIVVVSGRE